MTVYTIWIVNKAGGLVYHKTITEGFHPKLSSNDYLVMASTFQSVHAISSKVSPISGSSGVETIDWQSSNPFQLHCLQTPTGLKFLMTTSASHPNYESLLRRVYEVYSDYALKNPFHTMEMPVKSELFDNNLLKILQ